MPEGWQGFSLNPHAFGSQAVHAHGDDALGDLDAVGVAEAISAGRISAREATEAAIARIESVNDVLNAVQHADYERALEQSLTPDLGLLSGVPSIVKDNTAVAGLPTHQGSLAMRSGPATADDPFTRQLRGTGLVVLGKSTMPEFGFNASTEHETIAPTRNPWDPGRSAGGSSGGSAALVASQRFAPSADLPRLGLVEHASDRRLRIGLIMDSVSGVTDAEGRAVVLDTVELLTSLGHEVVDAPLPVEPGFPAAFKHYWAMLAFATQRFGRR